MPIYFFDINGKRDDIGVDLESREAAIADARTTVLRLAEYERQAFSDSWTCLVRDKSGMRLHQVTLALKTEDLSVPISIVHAAGAVSAID
jgi:hypothetical protein